MEEAAAWQATLLQCGWAHTAPRWHGAGTAANPQQRGAVSEGFSHSPPLGKDMVLSRSNFLMCMCLCMVLFYAESI